ncbi:MAG: hypothetical protein ACTHOJ_17195 [Sphingomonas oligoaromativorans]
MPIYKLTVAGDDKSRIVRAATAAKARDHVVRAETVGAEDLADLIEAGVTIEKAEDKPKDDGAEQGEDVAAASAGTEQATE